jgi:prolipoprotein diacylglyceryltransferase
MILLRAYASIWDFVNSILGTNIPSIPPNTYGFMMAMAFIVGIYLARKELARKTELGFFPKETKEILVGQGIVLSEVLLYGAFGFFLGLKVIGIVSNFDLFIADPQGFLLSMQGSLAGGILFGLVMGGYTAYDQWKNKKSQPIKKIVSNNI